MKDQHVLTQVHKFYFSVMVSILSIWAAQSFTLPNDGRSISRHVASLNIPVHDVISFVLWKLKRQVNMFLLESFNISSNFNLISVTIYIIINIFRTCESTIFSFIKFLWIFLILPVLKTIWSTVKLNTYLL